MGDFKSATVNTSAPSERTTSTEMATSAGQATPNGLHGMANTPAEDRTMLNILPGCKVDNLDRLTDLSTATAQATVRAETSKAAPLSQKQAKLVAKRLAQSKADKAKQAGKRAGAPANPDVPLNLEVVLIDEDVQDQGDTSDGSYTISSARDLPSTPPAADEDAQEAQGAPAQQLLADYARQPPSLTAPAASGDTGLTEALTLANQRHTTATRYLRTSALTQELVIAGLRAPKDPLAYLKRWSTLADKLLTTQSSACDRPDTLSRDMGNGTVANKHAARMARIKRTMPAMHPLHRRYKPSQLAMDSQPARGSTSQTERHEKAVEAPKSGPERNADVDFQLGMYGHMTLRTSPAEQLRADTSAALLAKLLHGDQSSSEAEGLWGTAQQPPELHAQQTRTRPTSHAPRKLTLQWREAQAPCLVVASVTPSPPPSPSSPPPSYSASASGAASAATSATASACPGPSRGSSPCSGLPRIGAPPSSGRMSGFSVFKKAVRALFGAPAAVDPPTQPDAQLSEAARWLAEARAMH